MPKKSKAPSVSWRKVAIKAVGIKEVRRRERDARRHEISASTKRGMAIRGGSLTKQIKAQLEELGFSATRETYLLQKGKAKYPGKWDRFCIDLHDSYDLDSEVLDAVIEPIREIFESVYAGQPSYIRLGLQFVNEKKEVADGWRQLTATTDIRTTFAQTLNIDNFATRTTYLEFSKICIDVRRGPA